VNDRYFIALYVDPELNKNEQKSDLIAGMLLQFLNTAEYDDYAK